MAGGLTFGIYPFPQTAPYADLAERCRRVESMGFDALWVADETPMAFPGVIHFDAWSLLGALARETTRIRIGTLVTPVVFRHPLLLAMAVTTVDHASNGRVSVGVGAGGVREDLAGVGLQGTSGRELVDRMEEQVAMLDRLLRGETVTVAGDFYSTQDAVVERPIQRPRPPILVAAQGRRALRVVARHADIWNSIGGQPIVGARLSLDEALEQTRRQVEILDDECVLAGRDRTTVRRSVFAFRVDVYASTDAFAEFVGRYRELGFEDYVLDWPEEDSSAPGKAAILERIAGEVIPGLRLS